MRMRKVGDENKGEVDKRKSNEGARGRTGKRNEEEVEEGKRQKIKE